MNQQSDTPVLTPAIQILKKGQAPKLSPSAKGSLTYYVGVDPEIGSYVLRVTANETSGFFSNEWISLNAIVELIETKSHGRPFKAILFKDLYESKGANNHGFLAAILRHENILIADEFKPLSSLLGDVEAFGEQMQALLDDEVAAAESARAERKAQQMAQLQARRKSAEGGSLADSGDASAATSGGSLFDTTADPTPATTPSTSSAKTVPSKPASKKTPPAKAKRKSK